MTGAHCVCRCLSIGAPDQETKLQLLSEIAREHGVDWDSNRAQQEMVAGSDHLHPSTPVRQLAYESSIGMTLLHEPAG